MCVWKYDVAHCTLTALSLHSHCTLTALSLHSRCTGREDRSESLHMPAVRVHGGEYIQAVQEHVPPSNEIEGTACACSVHAMYMDADSVQCTVCMQRAMCVQRVVCSVLAVCIVVQQACSNTLLPLLTPPCDTLSCPHLAPLRPSLAPPPR
jgi:hypothetical protein